jgi:hypothetical protein
MSIISISAVGGGLNFANSPYSPPATSTRSTTQLASGAAITTVRGATGDVVAVTTEALAAPVPSLGSQLDRSTFYVTA